MSVTKQLRSAGYSDLAESLRIIRNEVEAKWSVNQSPDFTDHSWPHSIRVANYAQLILDRAQLPKEQRLSTEELYLLEAASFLHDIGMQDFRRADEAPHAKVQPEDVSRVRASHASRSASAILRNEINVGLPIADGTTRAILSQIVGAHGTREFPSAYAEIVSKAQTVRGKKVRGGAIAALLLMADELDLTYVRILTPAPWRPLNAESCAHWLKHQCVQTVDLEHTADGLKIWVTFDFPHNVSPQDAEAIRRWVMNKLQRQIALIGNALRDGFEGHLRFVPQPGVLPDGANAPATDLYREDAMKVIRAENAWHKLINHRSTLAELRAAVYGATSMMVRVSQADHRKSEVEAIIHAIVSELERDSYPTLRDVSDLGELGLFRTPANYLAMWKQVVEKRLVQRHDLEEGRELPIVIVTSITGGWSDEEVQHLARIAEAEGVLAIVFCPHESFDTPADWLELELEDVAPEAIAGALSLDGISADQAIELARTVVSTYGSAQQYLYSRMEFWR